MNEVDKSHKFNTQIGFEFDGEKFVFALAFFAGLISNLTKLKALKLLYFADKLHLIKYGRPIIGDTYHAINLGPIPSIAKNVMDEIEKPSLQGKCYNEYLNDFRVYLDVRKSIFHPYPLYKQKKTPDLAFFSKSELEALNEIVKLHGDKTARQLVDISHDEKSYRFTAQPKAIDYRLFFDDPEHSPAYELMEETQEDRDIARLLNE